MILFVDNYDSFSYNLVDYLRQCGVQVEVIRNDSPIPSRVTEKYSGLVLSPGPKVPEESGNLLSYLEGYQRSLPILGVCLGHQAIGKFFGGSLGRAQQPMHGKVSQIYFEEDPIFKEIDSPFEATQYNSLVLSDSGELRVIAKSASGEIMGIRHNELPIWGLQFHPEAILSKFGLKIISNWLEYNNIV